MWWPCEHTVFSRTRAGIRARCRCPSTIKDELGYKLGTGKKNSNLTGAFRSSQEVVETCPCVPDRNGIWKCLFLRRGKTEIHGGKPLGTRTRTNNKLNPPTCMGSTPGFKPGPYWWEASALTTASLRIFVSLLRLSFKLATDRVKSGCQRKPGKMLKMSTEGGQQNKFILTSWIGLVE